MNKWIKVGLWIGIPFAIVALVSLIIYSTAAGYNNKFVHYEEEILAINHFVENKHNSMYQDLKSSGAIRNVSQADFRKMVEINMAAKIPVGSIKPGAFGGMAITRPSMGENMQGMDKDLIAKVQPYVKEIERAQTAKIKVVRDYKRTLRNIPDKWFASFFGFPSKEVDLVRESEIMSSAATKEATTTKVQGVIDPLK